MRLISLLCLGSMLVSFHSYSQTDGNFKYSIAAKGFSIIQLPKVFNQDYERFLNTRLQGGMIKFNENQMSYRLSGNYTENNLNFGNNCMNCDLTTGRMKDYAFKIGFEKSLNYACIQPYFALDLGYRFNQFLGIVNTLNNQRNSIAVHSLRETKIGYTISPGCGVKINPIPQLSIYIESGIEYFYANVRQDLTAQDVSAVKTKIRFNRAEFLLNPISIGIQLHLGNKN